MYMLSDVMKRRLRGLLVLTAKMINNRRQRQTLRIQLCVPRTTESANEQMDCLVGGASAYPSQDKHLFSLSYTPRQLLAAADQCALR